MKTLMMTTAMVVGIVINVAHAGPLPEAKPDDVGFSQQGLTRLDDFFAREMSADICRARKRLISPVVIARLDRATLYSRDGRVQPKSRGVPGQAGG